MKTALFGLLLTLFAIPTITFAKATLSNDEIYLKALRKDARFSNVQDLKVSKLVGTRTLGDLLPLVMNLESKAGIFKDNNLRFGVYDRVSFRDDRFQYSCDAKIDRDLKTSDAFVDIFDCNILSRDGLMILTDVLQADQ